MGRQPSRVPGQKPDITEGLRHSAAQRTFLRAAGGGNRLMVVRVLARSGGHMTWYYFENVLTIFLFSAAVTIAVTALGFGRTRLPRSTVVVSSLITLMPVLINAIGLPHNVLHRPRLLTSSEAISLNACVLAFFAYFVLMIVLTVQSYKRGGLATHTGWRALLYTPAMIFGILFCGFMLAASAAMIESTPWF